MKRSKARIYIGTSGWIYKDWKEVFYPRELKPKDQLSFIAKRFNSVEINNTFYRIPRGSTVKGWSDATPEDFVFAVKLNNYLTHTKRLILDDASRARLQLFARVMKPLASKAQALLVQLPPSLKANHDRLDTFLYELSATVPLGQKVFCEFRHPSWLAEKTYKILRTHEAGFVIPAYPGRFRDNYPVTCDAAYVRYHASDRRSNYPERELDKWAVYIGSLSKSVNEVYAYFNNDHAARAIVNARYLQEKV